MKLIIHWIALSVAVYAASYFVPGISVAPFWVAPIIGACLAFFNMLIKPVITVITLPINILTAGLFSLVINGAVLWFLATVVQGFSVASFTAAFLGGLFISVVNFIAGKLFRI